MKLSSNDFVILLSQIGTILILSKLFWELSRKLNISAVIGEILLGIVLGPTILGNIFPSIFNTLFPESENIRLAFDSLVSISVVIFLFVAGFEVDLSLIKGKIKNVLIVSLTSFLIPFLTGFYFIIYFPELLINSSININIFATFIGLFLSVSALPVIIRILLDMKLFKTNFGSIVTMSVIVIDIITWLIFSILLGFIDNTHQKIPILYTIILINLFLVFSLTKGIKLTEKLFDFINKKSSHEETVAFSLGLCLLISSFTEYIGTHAIIGSFIFGIVLGNCKSLTQKTKETFENFSKELFVPLFFVSIGLRIDFIKNFDLIIFLIIIILSFITKIIGTFIGARLSGMKNNESLALSFAMNARGGMGIILADLALNMNLISEEIFVSLVITSLLTSFITPFLIKKCYIEQLYVKN